MPRFPHCQPEVVGLLVGLLKAEPSQRLTAVEALSHPYFEDIRQVLPELAAANPEAFNCTRVSVRCRGRSGGI